MAREVWNTVYWYTARMMQNNVHHDSELNVWLCFWYPNGIYIWKREIWGTEEINGPDITLKLAVLTKTEDDVSIPLRAEQILLNAYSWSIRAQESRW